LHAVAQIEGRLEHGEPRPVVPIETQDGRGYLLFAFQLEQQGLGRVTEGRQKLRMPTPEVRVLGAGPNLGVRILQRLGLGAEIEIGHGLEPAWHGLGALGLPSLDLIRDFIGELLREVVSGAVFADVLNGVVEAQGFTVTLSASQRANACSLRAPDARSRTARAVAASLPVKRQPLRTRKM